jgi:hypothetical protein
MNVFLGQDQTVKQKPQQSDAECTMSQQDLQTQGLGSVLRDNSGKYNLGLPNGFKVSHRCSRFRSFRRSRLNTAALMPRAMFTVRTTIASTVIIITPTVPTVIMVIVQVCIKSMTSHCSTRKRFPVPTYRKHSCDGGLRNVHHRFLVVVSPFDSLTPLPCPEATYTHIELHNQVGWHGKWEEDG